MVASLCLSVCSNFRERSPRKFIFFLVCRFILRIFRSSSYIKLTAVKVRVCVSCSIERQGNLDSRQLKSSYTEQFYLIFTKPQFYSARVNGMAVPHVGSNVAKQQK